jgi:hypothetical protein
MKKTFVILFSALALLGCKQEGGTSDQYNTATGTSSSVRTNTEYPVSQGSSTSPSGTNSSSATSETPTNSSNSITNNPNP